MTRQMHLKQGQNSFYIVLSIWNMGLDTQSLSDLHVIDQQ